MAQRAHVPKFGNWDNNANVPYTQYFDNARKGRGGGKLINPNDPQENPEAASFEEAPPFDGSPEAKKSKHERRLSREDDVTRKLTTDSPHHQYGDRVNSGVPQRRTSRLSGGGGSDSNARSSSRAPQWERRAESYGHAPNSPRGSRMRLVGRSNDIPEKGSAVPKFGEWDEGDPASADGYTHIFEKLRNERDVSSAEVPPISNDSASYLKKGHKRVNSSESVSCCCFSLSK